MAPFYRRTARTRARGEASPVASVTWDGRGAQDVAGFARHPEEGRPSLGAERHEARHAAVFERARQQALVIDARDLIEVEPAEIDHRPLDFRARQRSGRQRPHAGATGRDETHVARAMRLRGSNRRQQIVRPVRDDRSVVAGVVAGVLLFVLHGCPRARRIAGEEHLGHEQGRPGIHDGARGRRQRPAIVVERGAPAGRIGPDQEGVAVPRVGRDRDRRHTRITAGARQHPLVNLESIAPGRARAALDHGELAARRDRPP